MPDQHEGRYWTVNEAREGFETLLAAAQVEPQFIAGPDIRYVLSAFQPGSAREFLARGGPGEEDDDLLGS